MLYLFNEKQQLTKRVPHKKIASLVQSREITEEKLNFSTTLSKQVFRIVRRQKKLRLWR